MEKSKNILDTVKEFFSGKDKTGKIQFLAILVLIGILLVMFANSLINPSSNTEDAYSKESFASSDETVSGDEVASQIESILGEIKGVGKVKVLITYKNSGTNVYAKDVSRTTDAEEQKSQDGKTVIKKTEDLTSSLVFTGQKQPIIEEKTSAEVKGVLVVAEGANDPTVCAQILHAVRVLTGVESHKIAICPYK
ncbi:MAG: hypothetical protein ACOX3Q_13485 [Clostridia bacterium]|nr:hypothetical protein [Clostridiaceae bacterium]